MYINEFLDYIDSEKRFSAHTIKSYRTDLLQFFKYLNAEFDVSNPKEIDFNLIRSWMVFNLEKGIKAVTVNRKISTLRTYFKFLMKEKNILSNPVLKISPPKSKKRLPVFIEEKKIQYLLDEIKFPNDFNGQRDKLIIELFYFTGIRLSELIELKIKSIDFINGSVKVVGKRNKERVIPLLPDLLQKIKIYIQNQNPKNYLFTTNKFKKLYTKLVYRIVRKYIGFISSSDKKSPHILRHTFATHMLNNGADINAIKELLGHSNLSATQIYTHNTIDKLKSVYKQAHPRA